MKQEVEKNQTGRNLDEFVQVFLYATIFAFVFEGLLLICLMIYSSIFYRFVSWIQWNEYIGMVITYTIFIAISSIMLHLTHKALHFSNRSVVRGFFGAMALFSIVFPITPITWYGDMYPLIPPSPAFGYGIDYHLWPLLCLIGFAALSILIMDLRSDDGSESYKTTLLFSGILATSVTIVSMFVLSVPPNTGHLDSWATPFYLLPHVSGLTLLLETIRQHIGSSKKQSEG
ncbi:MAG: hypothetical protein ACTSSE_11940 [Candidatus Thorarchaeota archaeon]